MSTINELKLDKYKSVGNALRRVVKDNWKDRLTIELGDVKQPDKFFPQLKICRWGNSEEDNEVNASFRLKGFDNFTSKKENNRLKLQKDKKEVHLYELENGFEFEVVLLEKPVNNVIEFSLETKGLNFYYQPPLTECEKVPEGGTVTETEVKDKNGRVLVNRPENVVGSYAVYHNGNPVNYKDGKLYKAGKAFHIYRPKIFDSEGKWTWGELNIDIEQKLLTVTIPQEFLDNAVYPIRHASGLLFGYDTGDTTWPTSFQNVIVGAWFTLSEAGVASSISIYTNTIGTYTAKCAIYRKSDEVLMGVTEERTGVSGVKAWYQFDFVSGVELAADDYILVAWSPDNVPLKGGTGSSEQGYTRGLTYNTYPNPLAHDGHTDIKYSIYCTYEAGEEEVIGPFPTHFRV